MLVVFGSINVDLVFPVAALPRAGETVLGGDYRVVPGGKGANQAVAAARDGAAVVFYGCVGRDAFAGVALDAMRSAGVDVSQVAAVDAPTGCAAICVDAAGENQIAVATGANGRARADQVADGVFGPSTTLLLQMEVPARETAALIARARDAGARILLNLAPAGELPAEALRALDVLVANEGEAAWLSGLLGLRAKSVEAVAEEIASRLGIVAIVTRGAGGTIVARAGEATWSVPALAITPVDTTAAGDAFAGVLAAALDRGVEMSVAVRRANVAAGLACLKLGAQTSLPTRQEIDRQLGNIHPR